MIFYKNIFYKNIHAQMRPFIKNMLRISSASKYVIIFVFVYFPEFCVHGFIRSDSLYRFSFIL